MSWVPLDLVPVSVCRIHTDSVDIVEALEVEPPHGGPIAEDEEGRPNYIKKVWTWIKSKLKGRVIICLDYSVFSFSLTGLIISSIFVTFAEWEKF